MKTLLTIALIGFSSLAAAGEVQPVSQPDVVQYNYSQKLDIAKVVHLSAIPDVCEVVPAQMTYEDHQGQRHTIEYRVMGNGCTNF
ncbi:hypothetical protein D3C76_1059570 [compost metagenome]